MPASPMELFAIRKFEELIDNVVFALHDAQRLHETDAVHRLRVSIRRLQQALRVFAQYLKTSGVKRVRTQLKKAMRAAGDLRNHDIAIELIKKNGKDFAEIHAARTASKKVFRTTLRQMTKKDLGVKWRAALGLPS
jgi:CHAD domain-containing protein